MALVRAEDGSLVEDTFYGTPSPEHTHLVWLMGVIAETVVARALRERGGVTLYPAAVTGWDLASYTATVLLDGEDEERGASLVGRVAPAVGDRVLVMLAPPSGAWLLGYIRTVDGSPPGPELPTTVHVGDTPALGPSIIPAPALHVHGFDATGLALAGHTHSGAAAADEQIVSAIELYRSTAQTLTSNVEAPVLYDVTDVLEGPQATVTNKALTSNVATLTTGSAHGWAVGNTVVVAGVDATFNGTYTLTAVGATTISYAKVAANVASAAAAGTATLLRFSYSSATGKVTALADMRVDADAEAKWAPRNDGYRTIHLVHTPVSGTARVYADDHRQGNGAPLYGVTQRARASNVATLTIDAGHPLQVGDTINVSGVGSGFDSTVVAISAKTVNTISYANTGSAVSTVASTGQVYRVTSFPSQAPAWISSYVGRTVRMRTGDTLHVNALWVTPEGTATLDLLPGDASGWATWLTVSRRGPLPALPPTAPGAPTIGTATGGNAQAVANWTAGSNNGSAITGYSVDTHRASDGLLLATNTVGVVLTYTKTGLTNGLAIYFVVRAINAAGTGSASSNSNTVTPTASATVPTAPTSLSATSPGAGTLNGGWSPPASDGGSAVTAYQWEAFDSGGLSVGSGSGMTFGFSISVPSGDTYSFQVRAVNSVGNGPFATSGTVLVS